MRASPCDDLAVEIRPVSDEEFEALADLTVAAYEELFDEPLGDYEHALRDVAARASDSVVLVAVDGQGQLLGGVTYVPGSERDMSEFDDDEAAGIRMLAVDPRHQGAGVGRALVVECLSRAHDAGRARVVLHSTIYMTRAQTLYKSLGFMRDASADVAITDEPYSTDRPFMLLAYVLAL